VDVQQLVTHNTAILGILGVGKTFLALELVERMLVAGIRVIVLDLTNQYAAHLAPYYDANAEQPNIDSLKAKGPAGKANYKPIVSEGGSVQAFQAELKLQLSNFMADANARLRIYNPTAFEVWKQDSKLYSGTATMAQLTPTEITRIITEIALELCSTTITDQAKLCIVYEEAHSLIPEWNAVASEGDKAATNGTAKAILQGRKYGLGCLVITQRTANVTKTILNQCNTVFALRVFDSTGMEFLRNYIGDDYSGILSTLENRHAIVFGRASSCSDPVLVRLNDRDKFLRLNRAQP
jgi:DNA helicase HerA-like ATPase